MRLVSSIIDRSVVCSSKLDVIETWLLPNVTLMAIIVVQSSLLNRFKVPIIHILTKKTRAFP